MAKGLRNNQCKTMPGCRSVDKIRPVTKRHMIRKECIIGSYHNPWTIQFAFGMQ